MIRVYNLGGLHCAHCAGLIEEDIKKIEVLKNAMLDFMNKKIIVDSELDEDEVDSLVEEVVHAYEPEVNVSRIHSKDRASGRRHISLNELILVITSIIFIMNIIFIRGNIHIAINLSIYALTGYKVYIASAKSMLRGSIFDENFLMVVASLGAVIIGEYNEATAVMLLYGIGELLQDMAVEKSRRSIKSLLSLSTKYATVVKETGNIEVLIEDIEVGDIVVIKPGDSVVVDGVVIGGQSSIDTSSLTGEAIPVFVEKNSKVMGGTMNLEGALKIRVTKEYKDSSIAKILSLVESAGIRKSKMEKVITKFAKIYTPIVCLAAALLVAIPSIFTGNIGLWLSRALVFLVISCPCAIVISVPLTYFASIGKFSRLGIMIKGSEFLDAINDADTVVFDKTGTLTTGVFKVSNITLENNFTENDILKYAYAVEGVSTHPIAKAIIKKAKEKNIALIAVENMKNIAGKGIVGIVSGKNIALGNKKLLSDLNVDLTERKALDTIMYLVVDGTLAGSIEIEDEIKKSARRTIDTLLKMGKRVVMLTGDSDKVAKRVAEELNIKEVYSELLPEDKVQHIENIKADTSSNVIFVGDGINDAPVLMVADVGVAIGDVGSDAAIEASDIILTNGSPFKLVTLFKRARLTKKVVMIDIGVAFFIKLISFALGAFGLMNMWLAVFVDVGVCLALILYSLSITRK